LPDLIVLTGPPASGKAAIGHALATLTGFRFFHNHMTAEAAAALFGWATPAYVEAVGEMRMMLLSRALALADAPDIIFTYAWAFDDAQDCAFVAGLVKLFGDQGCKVFFVELLASTEARMAREGTPLRLALKPAKRDVESARALHQVVDAKYQLNSSEAFPHPYPQRHLLLDTERQSPEASARLVMSHYGFTAK
jgi:chloramphenicol 3-O-phosphotransferase